jgi:hypothetical protein
MHASCAELKTEQQSQSKDELGRKVARGDANSSSNVHGYDTFVIGLLELSINTA